MKDTGHTTSRSNEEKDLLTWIIDLSCECRVEADGELATHSVADF